MNPFRRLLRAFIVLTLGAYLGGVGLAVVAVDFQPGQCRAPYYISFAAVWPVWQIRENRMHRWLLDKSIELCWRKS